MSHRGSKARSIAVRSVVNNEAFIELPKVGTDGELTIGYLRNMKHKLSKRIGLEMLVEDLLHIDTTLRPKLLQNIEDLDDTRYSRSEEHTSELQSLMRISYAVFCLKKKNKYNTQAHIQNHSQCSNHHSNTISI